MNVRRQNPKTTRTAIAASCAGLFCAYSRHESQLVERKLSSYFADQPDGIPPVGLYDRVLEEVERPLIQLTLSATRGNQVRAAEILGLNRNTLRKKISDLGVEMQRGRR